MYDSTIGGGEIKIRRDLRVTSAFSEGGGGGGMPLTNFIFAKRIFFFGVRRRRKFLGFPVPTDSFSLVKIAFPE